MQTSCMVCIVLLSLLFTLAELVRLSDNVGGTFVEIPLQNPWQTKAAGKIICHIPLVLYCDDLSGNISKKWNKHLAFYFTLAGLPPKLSNQEYNCHFLTTSNTAGASELSGPLVTELKSDFSSCFFGTRILSDRQFRFYSELATDGFVAYDHLAQKEVLAIPFILCHLGDSPMHAEVTNTMNPTVSLTPCRICHLKVENLMEKRSVRYVSEFVGIDKSGNKVKYFFLA